MRRYGVQTGTKIAFRASNDNGAYGHALYMMSVDGSSVSLLASSPGGDARPVFSPDGTKLAFESYRNMNSDIYIQDLHGTPNSPHRLTDDPQDDRNPVFSPDGTKIAFIANRDGNAEIYVMNLDGTNQTNLTNTPTRGEQIPKWAPALVSDSGVE
jgi:TolB protein